MFMFLQVLSPFMRRLFGTQDTTPDRVEDDKTGERQSGSPSSDVGTTPRDPGFYASAYHPMGLPSSTIPLERQLASDKNEYNRLVAPPPPMTLAQRIKGFVTGGVPEAVTGTPMYGPAATLRDRAEQRKLQERESLAGRISAGQRELVQAGLGEERIQAQAQSLSQRLAEQERLRQMINDAAMQRTELQQAGAGERTAAGIQSREAMAVGKRGDVKVFGNGSYERLPGADPLDPTQDKWRYVGPAPPQATREQGNYQPVPDPNNPNQIAGWVDVKSRHFVSPDQIQGMAPATTPATTPGGTPTVMAKVTGQTKSRADAAVSIMPLIASVRQQLDDPDIQKNLGVLAGNWNEVQRRAAGAMPDLTPIERQKVRRFAGTLTSIYSLGGTMHGWRALQVAKEFESRYGGIPAGQSELLGSMQALEETANSVARTGGYGQGAAPGGLGAPAAPGRGGQRVSLEDFLKER